MRLATLDAHEGLKQAIATVLSGATWQRCRAHFMHNLLATVPKGARGAIAAVVGTIFAQPDPATAMTQLRKVRYGGDVLDAVNDGDVRMIQRCERAALAFKALDPAVIEGYRFRQDLHRNVAMEARVAGAIDLSQPRRGRSAWTSKTPSRTLGSRDNRIEQSLRG